MIIPTHFHIDSDYSVMQQSTVKGSPLMKRSVVGSEAIFLILKQLSDDVSYRRGERECG